MSLEEVKKSELNILLYLKEICDKNDLNYYLHGGTLIGALRHKGFIPWDDDIDIAMPREDYKKFLEINKSQSTKYKALNFADNENYYYAFSKLIDIQTYIKGNNERTEYGVFIDIFPIDNVPQKKVQKLIYFSKASIYKRILSHLNEINPKKDNNLIKMLLRHFVRLLNYKKILVHFDKYIQKFPEGKELSTITTGAQWDISYKAEWFSQKVMVTFEGYDFPAPVGYDSLLRKYFGNYMIVPEHGKQNSHGYVYVCKG